MKKDKKRTDEIEESVKALYKVNDWVGYQMEERKMKNAVKTLFWLVGAVLLFLFGIVGLILWIIDFFVTL